MYQRKNLLTHDHEYNSYNKAEHILIERKSLIKLFFKPIDKIKGSTSTILNKIYKKFPIYKKIIDIVYDFRALLKNKTAGKSDNWLLLFNKVSNLNIIEINSVKRDVEAVENAIIYHYNNWLAEGSVIKWN
ncbi:hypothetical protein psyc5s11_07280 [Clostridium gelidum]|uniref:Uncharacterized protein n=1 Tax=Clostridium gelidum TaxID=704125 RepID=A0ABM7SYG2_9CLOT|nr:hypothetical protein [Clostridium gelidum]BCZ44661.1 hypothetical protein psyc5s11_07280 [Clostridium gelidum]